jgi:hypothetical protein
MEPCLTCGEVVPPDLCDAHMARTSWVLSVFGECQVIAQTVARR